MNLLETSTPPGSPSIALLFPRDHDHVANTPRDPAPARKITKLEIDESSPHFERARPWVQELFAGRETVALAWVVCLAFVRLTTKPQVMTSPLTVDEALDIVDGWLALPNVVVVHPTVRHAAVLRELLSPSGSGGNLVTDAHLAALAIEHGAELISCDADFSRFSGLRWRDPLR